MVAGAGRIGIGGTVVKTVFYKAAGGIVGSPCHLLAAVWAVAADFTVCCLRGLCTVKNGTQRALKVAFAAVCVGAGGIHIDFRTRFQLLGIHGYRRAGAAQPQTVAEQTDPHNTLQREILCKAADITGDLYILECGIGNAGT